MKVRVFEHFIQLKKQPLFSDDSEFIGQHGFYPHYCCYEKDSTDLTKIQADLIVHLFKTKYCSGLEIRVE